MIEMILCSNNYLTLTRHIVGDIYSVCIVLNGVGNDVMAVNILYYTTIAFALYIESYVLYQTLRRRCICVKAERPYW